MQVHRIRPTLCIAALLLGLQAVYGATAAAAASVNGVTISDADITAATRSAGMPDTPSAREAIKQQLIARELFRQEASKDKALEARADVQAQLRDARNQILMQAWLKDHIKPEPVTEAQVRARYDAIVATLGEREYKARVIEVADDAAANAALARIKAGEDFARVAQAVSLSPSRSSGGALEWISFKVPAQDGHTQSLPLPLAQAVSSLPAGAVSPAPIAWNERRYLVKVDAVRATQVPAYDVARPGIQQALQAQALEKATIAMVTQLLLKAKITQ
ncbi:MAG: peptidyl-prolyl cis-trans isomerase [Rhizobium sp.]|nr:MAG: peptidyl-prolyl cis-trans isomerase [Rhizobium sp.]